MSGLPRIRYQDRRFESMSPLARVPLSLLTRQLTWLGLGPWVNARGPIPHTKKNRPELVEAPTHMAWTG